MTDYTETSQDTSIVEGEVVYDTKAVFTNQGLSNLEELDVQVKSMVASAQSKDGKHRTYFCTVCEKEGVHSLIKNHIVANHIEGVSIPCNFCEKSLRSQNSLRMHVKNYCFTTKAKTNLLDKNMEIRTKQPKVHKNKLQA